jgi:hypothetical protein
MRRIPIAAFGQSKPLHVWSEESGISQNALYSRIFRRGWPAEVALSKPTAPTNPRKNRVEEWPGASTLRWDDDEVAQQRLAERDAFTLEEIGRMLGLGRERVRQIEERALAKLARLMGGDKDKVVESLRALSQERDQRRSAWEMMDTDS